MAIRRLIPTALGLLLAAAVCGGPALAADPAPRPPAPPHWPGDPMPGRVTQPAPPVTVDQRRPLWEDPSLVPPPSIPDTSGPGNVEAVCSPCLERRDECGWRLDTRGCRYGRLDLTLEGLWTIPDQPSGLMGVPVAHVAPGPVLPPQFDWDGVDYEPAFGGRLGLAFRVGPFSRLELRAAYYGNFTGEQSQTGAFGFRPGPGGTGGVSAVTTTTLEMEADLYSGELNFWEDVSCKGRSRLVAGGGVRVWRYEETAAATNWGAPVVPGAGLPALDSKARSDFIGLQLGGAWHFDFSPCFEFRAGGKVLVGNVNQQCRVRDANLLAGGPHTSSVEADEIRLGADVDLGFLWRLHPRFGITFGYNLLILDGVARANEVMDFTASTSGAVQARLHDGQVINHAFFVGVNLNF